MDFYSQVDFTKKQVDKLQKDLDKLNLLFIKMQQKHKFVLNFKISKGDINYDNIVAETTPVNPRN